jgi:hypothetical protein
MVFASLQPGTMEVVMGYGMGVLDGGFLERIPIKHFPPECRMPNTLLLITIRPFDREIQKIERMSKEEATLCYPHLFVQ